MDKYLYIAMTGAQQTLRAQAVNTHNLANASTSGYRADLAAFESFLVRDGVTDSARVNAVARGIGFDASAGPIQHTGRDLDVAINGPGWLAVQAFDGSEAYTRAGDLRVSANGVLETGAGHPVVGDGGPIAIPPAESVHIGRDGTVSIVPLGQRANVQAEVGRIRLVNPPPDELARGEDGLFRMRDGSLPPADAAVTLTQGALEGSNVNTTEALINMIELARRYETQVKLLRTAEQNDERAASLMSLK